ncbi:GNAT family N-acetyltransferase [Planktomarina temperata]|nr:GNAT family N-acetyltransferase [Planktomarina temperata]
MNSKKDVQIISHTVNDLKRGSLEHLHDPYNYLKYEHCKRCTFLTNPYHKNDDTLNHVAVVDDKVIGKVDYIRIEQRPGNLEFYWLSDFIVHQDYRDSAAGFKLLISSLSMGKRLAVSGASEVAYKLYKKFKWRDYSLNRYILLLKSENIVNNLLKYKYSIYISSKIINYVIKNVIKIRIKNTKTFGHYEVLTVTKLEADLRRCELSYVDSSEINYYSWLAQSKFSSDPRNSNQLVGVYDVNGKLISFFLMKNRFHERIRESSISNIVISSLAGLRLVSPDACIKDVLFSAVDLAKTRDSDLFEFCPLPGEEQKLNLKIPFLQRGKHKILSNHVRSSENDILESMQFRQLSGDAFFS